MTEKTNKSINDSTSLARESVLLLLEKKGRDVSMLNVADFTSVTEYYVNATARSSQHVLSLADDIDERLSSLGEKPLRIEGRSGGAWILIDFGNVIVNIFDEKNREFYNLDKLFPAECSVDITDLKNIVDEKFKI